MPDLLTHAASALLWKAATRGPHVASFVAGSLLPDLLSRVPSIALTMVDQRLMRLPDTLLYITGPLHMPVGMALSAYGLSLLFDEAQRRAVARGLMGGMLLHLALDLTQFHYGVGYSLLYPLTKKTFELGWIGSEATVFIAVPALLLSIAALRWRRPDLFQKGIDASSS